MEDGHVQEPILMGHYDKEQGDYFVIKSQVKPRTKEHCSTINENGTTQKKPFYDLWIIVGLADDSVSFIKSAYCDCVGGIDGYCRHVNLAALNIK